MVVKVHAVGGPLDGKRYVLPEGMVSFPARGGRYVVDGDAAAWVPAQEGAPVEAAALAAVGVEPLADGADVVVHVTPTPARRRGKAGV